MWHRPRRRYWREEAPRRPWATERRGRLRRPGPERGKTSSPQAELAEDIKRPGNACHTVHMVTRLLVYRSEARPVWEIRRRVSKKAPPATDYNDYNVDNNGMCFLICC